MPSIKPLKNTNIKVSEHQYAFGDGRIMMVYRLISPQMFGTKGVFVDDVVMEWVRKFAYTDSHCPVVNFGTNGRPIISIFDDPDHPTVYNSKLSMVTNNMMIAMFKERST